MVLQASETIDLPVTIATRPGQMGKIPDEEINVLPFF
jgi:hypothetical protein